MHFFIVGGGAAFLFREPCKLLSTPTAPFKSFELSSVTSNFLTLIWLYITSIGLLNLLPNLVILCLYLIF